MTTRSGGPISNRCRRTRVKSTGRTLNARTMTNYGSCGASLPRYRPSSCGTTRSKGAGNRWTRTGSSVPRRSEQRASEVPCAASGNSRGGEPRPTRPRMVGAPPPHGFIKEARWSVPGVYTDLIRRHGFISSAITDVVLSRANSVGVRVLNRPCLANGS